MNICDGLAVHIDLEGTLAVDGDIVLSVDRHHRNFAKHIEYRVRLGIVVGLYIIRHLVGLHLHQRLLCHHLNAFQLLGIVLYKKLSEADRAACRRQLYLAYDFLAPHRAERDEVTALSGHFLGELPVLSRDRHGYRLLAFSAFVDSDCSERLSLMGQRIEQLSRYGCRLPLCSHGDRQQYVSE